MDVRESPSIGLYLTYRRSSMALKWAVLEWMLMFMLFLDASFSYLVTKFACYCGLQIPCLLCSRLDRVVGKEKKGFYWDLICVNHKSEISSRVLCHAHNKLADVHQMCENCLFSFATINKSNAETYRLLVGKMGEDPPALLDQYILSEGHDCDSLGIRICSCCNQQWSSKGFTSNQLCTTSFRSEFEAPEHGEHLSLSNEYQVDELKKTRDEPAMSFRISLVKKNRSDPFSHVEYSKMKLTSDTESSIPSDDDTAGALLYETENFKGSLSVHSVQLDPRERILADDVTIEKFIDPPPSELSVVESDVQRETIDLSRSVKITEAIGHELKVLNRQHVDHKIDLSGTSDLISFDEAPPSNVTKELDEPISFTEAPSYGVTKASVDISGEPCGTGDNIGTMSELISEMERELVTTAQTRSAETFIMTEGGSHIPNDSGLREQTTETQSPEIEPAMTTEICSAETSVATDTGPDVPKNLENEPVMATETCSGDMLVMTDSGSQMPRNMDLFEAVTVTETCSAESELETTAKTCSAESELETTTKKCSAETSVTTDAGSHRPNNLENESVATNETRSEEPFVMADPSSHTSNDLDLGDAYKLAVGSMRKQLSGKLLEQLSLKDSTKVNEDLKLLFSQMSAARGLELPLSNISPRLSVNSDDMKSSDSSIAIGMNLLQRRVSLERNESGLSLDGTIVGEIEGEGVLDRLKRQVEHDRKLLGALYKELEEERNASAVATNQAMAMITRLQEEKSALHMEALQCLRMMEEQAEYDAEALQKTIDLLADKEKEIQYLEAELELYKKKLGYTLTVETIQEPVSDSSSASHISMVDNQGTSNKTNEDVIFNNDSNGPRSPLLWIEDERS